MAMKWPLGIRSAGVPAGIKDGGELDLGVIVADVPVEWAGVFTLNAAAAASVGWCRSRLGHPARAIVVNSGNANACTGEAGQLAVQEVVHHSSSALGCSPLEVLVASTGPIGIPLPVEAVTGAVPVALEKLEEDSGSFARSILTTDSTTKVASALAGSASVVGVAKGAAMLAPNMATMLAFIATDAAVAPGELQPLLARSADRSFGRISVDACESTNDSVFLLTTGIVPVALGSLQAAVEQVCRSLAEQMVRDAEGGSKFLRIQVTGAVDESAAVAAGRAIAASDLWRAALYGADPNWGRVLAALGQGDHSLDLADVTLAIGPEVLFDHGEPCGSPDAARKIMEADEVTVSCTIGSGPGAAEVLSSDLTPAYVELNAGGTT
jgi:glutamate N-acetyltransferase / amino-acid N-acetyltransferase